MKTISRFRTLGLVAALLLAPLAMAQDGDKEPVELLEDFLHYGAVAKPDLAAGNGQMLLESGITNAELAVIVDDRITEDRFESVISRMLLVPELEDLVADISRRVELGRLDLARDGQRIEEAIGMLTGTLRQERMGRSRLEAAGEYAVPALLREITESRDEKSKQKCKEVLTDIGRAAVSPLCAALQGLDPQSQRAVCERLGEIG
jgi:hypothetical protein